MPGARRRTTSSFPSPNAALNKFKKKKRPTQLPPEDTPSYFGRANSCGFMLILLSLAIQPDSCRYVCTPSRIRICVKPISLMNSSFACSESEGMVLVTLNMVLTMS